MKLTVLSRFGVLPGPVKAMLTLSAASLGLIFFMVANHVIRNGVGDIGRILPFIIWIVVALVVILVILLVIEFIRRWHSKKKGDSLAGSIEANAKAAPRSASPEQKQKIEEMRKSFLRGLETFRENGKNVYEVPWYMVVGVPGSGKTEAVRRSGISFPPDLNQSLQGVGGTINMDWWFANDAVILDTAGRILVEDVDTGGTSEWDQLLEQLRRFRKNRPINGVMIVLPAASSRQESDRNPAGLVEESSADVEENVARFVDRLVRIRRRLKVRFPVCIVVTKCDRLLGFEEFFYSLSNASDQAQMLGWSNPNPLDQPYDGQMVNNAIKQIADRLRTMRMWILRNPIHSTDANARRTDEVDGLYALPDALESLVPNLRLYLDRMFTKSAWYDPPFLRGIYFTSSIQEGSALDPILAEMFHVQPRDINLPTPVPQEKRSYFLRDVLEKKLFVERGLVTSAANVASNERRLKMFMWGGALVATILLVSAGLVGFLCQASWNENFLAPWKAAVRFHHGVEAEGTDESRPFRDETAAIAVEQDGLDYSGQDPVEIGEHGSVGELQRALFRQVTDSDDGFMCNLFHTAPAESATAQSRLFGRVVAGPAAQVALKSIGSEREDAVAGDAGRVLAELLRWATIAEGRKPEGRVVKDTRATGEIDFKPIADVLRFPAEDREAWSEDLVGSEDLAGYERIFETIAAADQGGREQFLKFALGLDDGDLREVRIRQFRKALDGAAGIHADSGATAVYKDLQQLLEGMDAFESQEQELWVQFGYQGQGLNDQAVWYGTHLKSTTALEAYSEAWQEDVEALSKAASSVESAWERIRAELKLESASAEDIATQMKARLTVELERRRDMFQRLNMALPEATPDADPEDGDWLDQMRASLGPQEQKTVSSFQSQIDDWQKVIDRSSAMFVTTSDGGNAFSDRVAAYEQSLPAAVAKQLDDAGLGGCDLWRFDEVVAAARPDSRYLNPIVAPVELAGNSRIAADVIRRALDVSGRWYVHKRVECMRSARWPDDAEIAAAFPEFYNTINTDALSSVVFTSFYELEDISAKKWVERHGIPAHFAPEVAGKLIRSAAALGGSLSDSDVEPWQAYWPQSDADARPLSMACENYAARYLAFWSNAMAAGVTPRDYRDWGVLRDTNRDWDSVVRDITSINITQVAASLQSMADMMDEIIQPIEESRDAFPRTSSAFSQAKNMRACLNRSTNSGQPISPRLLVNGCTSYVRSLTTGVDSAGQVSATLVGDLLQKKDQWPAFLKLISDETNNSCSPAYHYTTGLVAQFVNALQHEAKGGPQAEIDEWLKPFASRFPIDTAPVSGLRQTSLDLPLERAELVELPDGRFPEEWLKAFKTLRERYEEAATKTGSAGTLRVEGLFPDALATALAGLHASLTSEEALKQIRAYDQLLVALCGRNDATGGYYSEVRNGFTITTNHPGSGSVRWIAVYGGGQDPSSSDPRRFDEFTSLTIHNPIGDEVEVGQDLATLFSIDQSLVIDLLRDDWTQAGKDRGGELVRSIQLGPWAVLRMAFVWGEPDERDGRHWTISIPTGDVEDTVMIDLYFSRSVPAPKDWP